MIAATLLLGLVILAAGVYAVAYVAHETKWNQRERQIRWGGPADRTLPDRLAQYQIEAEHPDEYISTMPIEGKPYYQSEPTVWDNPKEQA